MPLHILSRSRTEPHAPIDLQRALIARILLVAVTCFMIAVAVVLVQSHLQTRQLENATADLVARHLRLQQFRIGSDLDLEERFPDWDSLLVAGAADGRCVSLKDAGGAIVRRDCIGLGRDAGAPSWFALLYDLVAPMAVAQERHLDGLTLAVTAGPDLAIGRAWLAMTQMLGVTTLTVVCLCILVYVAIKRALAPTKDIVAGLDQFAIGNFAYRLPVFRLAELQRIGEVANEMAARLEAALLERAQLPRRLMDAQEQERRHLARELHDEFAQNLAAISALAASIATVAKMDQSDLKEEAKTLAQIARQMMADLRDTLYHLRPADLEACTLLENLHQLIDMWNRTCAGKVRFELYAPEQLPQLADQSAIHIFRLAQEGLTNAARHAKARHVRLMLETSEQKSSVSMTIEDDGQGRASLQPCPLGGRGMLNMQERVAALGGQIAFDERPEGGFMVKLAIPLDLEGTAA